MGSFKVKYIASFQDGVWRQASYMRLGSLSSASVFDIEVFHVYRRPCKFIKSNGLVVYAGGSRPLTGNIRGTTYDGSAPKVYVDSSRPTIARASGNDWACNANEPIRELRIECEGLKSVDLSRLDTSVIVDLGRFVEGAIYLESMDLSIYEWRKLGNMDAMFKGCSSLEHVDFTGVDTSRVTGMSMMFSGCSSLEEVDLTGFDTTSLQTVAYMFENCSSLKRLDLSNFTTRTGYCNPMYMFLGCTNLEYIDLSNWGAHYADKHNMAGMFEGCDSLTAVKVTNCSPVVKEDLRYLLSIAVAGGSVYWHEEDGYLVPNIAPGVITGTFYEYPPEIVSGDELMDTFKQNGEFSFEGEFACYVGPKVHDNFRIRNAWGKTALTLDVTRLDTSELTSLWEAFEGLSDLTTLDLSNFNTSNVISMNSMLYGCSNLRTLDLSNFVITESTDTDYMFSACGELSKVKVANCSDYTISRLISQLKDNTGVNTWRLSGEYLVR